MPRDEVVFLQDMLEAVAKIETYSEGFKIGRASCRERV